MPKIPEMCNMMKMEYPCIETKVCNALEFIISTNLTAYEKQQISVYKNFSVYLLIRDDT